MSTSPSPSTLDIVFGRSGSVHEALVAVGSADNGTPSARPAVAVALPVDVYEGEGDPVAVFAAACALVAEYAALVGSPPALVIDSIAENFDL